MSKIHIGKKIREVLDKSNLTIVGFAKSISLTMDGAYKIFEKETIATDQLQKISKVLNHDFFGYYQNELNFAGEKIPGYGFASKEQVDSLERMVHILVKEIEKMRQLLPKAKKSKKKKKYTAKRQSLR